MLRIFKQYYPIRNIFFIIGEGLFIYASFLTASLIMLATDSIIFDYRILIKIFLIAVICLLCLYYNDLYDFRITSSLTEVILRLIQALGFSAILLAMIYLAFPDAIIGQGIFLLSIIFVILIITSWRFGYRWVLQRGLFDQKIIMLGSGDLIEDIKREISTRKDCGYRVIDEFPESKSNLDSREIQDSSLLCGRKYEGLAEVAKSMGAKKVIASFKERRQAFPAEELLKCRIEGIEVVDGNTFYEMLTGKLTVRQINPSWLIFAEGFQKSGLRLFVKRVLDLVLSSILLILFLPVILVTAVSIKLDSNGRVFFSQERLGRKRKPYRIHKFRSMVADAEKDSGPVWCREDDQRITRVGKWIRKWRIDEVPQLWNVLKGDMSFVGPRPEREFFVRELEKVIPYYPLRFAIKPGITGWAQVCYSYGASEEDAVEKMNYELFYIKNMSPLMDLMIVLKTIKIVLFGKGAR
jgi:sugar transferase (PEP-CTERM system associated)